MEETLKGKEMIAADLIEAVSEKLLAHAFVKAKQEIVKEKNRKFYPDYNFYVSVYYGNKLLKSRVLNSKGENHPDMERARLHDSFYEKNRKKNPVLPVYRYTKSIAERTVSMLRIGNLAIVVSDDDQYYVHIFSLIIAVAYTLLKATYWIKEWGQFHDIVKYFEKEDPDAYSLVMNTHKIAFGNLGGYKPD